ncbi:MAG TPA: asparagine synthase-related protein, partial [Spirochaetota bacterium]|nr:asparagine synthase-related protein [Spirochaetota bacterium]
TTQSDSEVILHLFKEKGTDCIKELDGMFAFAVTEGSTFMLGRDPVGIKPLYYGYYNGNLYFSSELGAMSLAELEEVHEFPAGHYYTPEQGFVQYYNIPAVKENKYTKIDKACQIIRERFTAAVKKRLLSDKEIHVGAFCSGGLDSSLVSAIAAKEIPNLHTFVVGMQDENGDDSDDLKASRLVAEHINSNHHELVFDENDYYEALPRVIGKLESYDPSLVRCAVPCYFTCKLAAKYVTVVLTGEGADEVFAGYHYMKELAENEVNKECRRCMTHLHNINLQRADRIGMLFSLELRVPFLDVSMLELGMELPADLKIHTDKHCNGARVEKWILRRAFADYLPEEVMWRYKAQYTQGAGCQSLGEKLAEQEISDKELKRMQQKFPHARLNSKEAAYYYKIFRRYHPQQSILKSIGIWSGFDFASERKQLKGTFDGNLSYAPNT